MKNIMMIGNTHFDPVWTWKCEEAMLSIHSTFRSALDRMKEDEEFIYSFATPPVFEWISRIDPEMFSEIQNRVKEGRWELCEGWWVQPDCFSACGESYARQTLYGQRYLMEKFGMLSKSVFNIDSFGHNSQIPQILKKSHMEYYCMCRPEKWFFEIPAPYFNWQGKDGSCVKTFRIGQYSEIYNKDMATNVNLAESNMLNAPCDEMMVYGVTNHGGAPTKKAISDIHKLSEEKDYDLIITSVEGYFKNQGEPTCTVNKEMITKNFGPYVNDRKTKIMNRLAEYAVINAEKSFVIAEHMLGTAYDNDLLTKLWKDILFNQFHDILGGASFKEAYFDAYNQLGGAIHSANEAMHLNLAALTKKIKTPGVNEENLWNLIVWNLNETMYDGYMEGEMQWLHEFPAYSGGIVLEDESGTKFPCQIITEKSVIPGFRTRVLFRASVPPMGYKMFKVIKIDGGKSDKIRTAKVQTDKFDIEFEEKTGFIKKLYSKKLGRTFTEILRPQCFEDLADSECFNFNTYGTKLESFALESIETVESGEFRTCLKIKYRFRNSFVTMYYSFYKDTDYFDVRYIVNWNETHIALKLISKVDYENLIVSSPFATEIRTGSASDEPMGEWLSIYDENEGISFIGDSSFAYNKIEDELGISVLRSCIYAEMTLDEEMPKEDYPVMEQGVAEGAIRVVIHKDNYTENKIPYMAKSFVNPPIVLCEPNHDGIYPSCHSFGGINAKSVYITAVKKSEDGCGDVVRLNEFSGLEQDVTLKYFDKGFSILVKPYEIKTLMIKDKEIYDVNITED